MATCSQSDQFTALNLQQHPNVVLLQIYNWNPSEGTVPTLRMNLSAARTWCFDSRTSTISSLAVERRWTRTEHGNTRIIGPGLNQRGRVRAGACTYLQHVQGQLVRGRIRAFQRQQQTRLKHTEEETFVSELALTVWIRQAGLAWAQLVLDSPVVWSHWGRGTGGTGAACRRGCAAPASWWPARTGSAATRQRKCQTRSKDAQQRSTAPFGFTWTGIWNWFRERMYSISTAMMNLWDTPWGTGSL